MVKFEIQTTYNTVPRVSITSKILRGRVGRHAEMLRRILRFMTYEEKLKDPRWQRKRLEIMERDEFKCKCCGDDKSTLHIHHLTYTKMIGQIHNRWSTQCVDPWSFDNKCLVTLCYVCHKREEDTKKLWPALARICDKKLMLTSDIIWFGELVVWLDAFNEAQADKFVKFIADRMDKDDVTPTYKDFFGNG